MWPGGTLDLASDPDQSATAFVRELEPLARQSALLAVLGASQDGPPLLGQRLPPIFIAGRGGELLLRCANPCESAPQAVLRGAEPQRECQLCQWRKESTRVLHVPHPEPAAERGRVEGCSRTLADGPACFDTALRRRSLPTSTRTARWSPKPAPLSMRMGENFPPLLDRPSTSRSRDVYFFSRSRWPLFSIMP